MRDSETHFDETRGLSLYGDSRFTRARRWREAFRLGFREASERVKEVVLILHSLVTGAGFRRRIYPGPLESSSPPAALRRKVFRRCSSS